MENLPENKPTASKEKLAKDAIEKTNSIKRIYIELDQSTHDQFEELRQAEKNPVRKIDFFSRIFQNGVRAAEILVENKKLENQQQAPPEEAARPSESPKEIIQEKIIYKIPWWAKIGGGLLAAIALILSIKVYSKT